jgi:hypothetical protein
MSMKLLAECARYYGADRDSVVAVLEAGWSGDWQNADGELVDVDGGGYLVDCYVDEDGGYLGPDRFGIEPVMDPTIVDEDAYAHERLASRAPRQVTPAPWEER